MAAATLVLVVLHPISRIRPEQGIEARRPVGFREMRARPEAHGERSLKALISRIPAHERSICSGTAVWEMLLGSARDSLLVGCPSQRAAERVTSDRRPSAVARRGKRGVGIY